MTDGNPGEDAIRKVIVSASPHCDLLHFVGHVPHPYGVITPQTMMEKNAECVKFSLTPLEREPSVTVSGNHPLFAPVVIPRVKATSSAPAAASEAGMSPYFPHSGVGLAQSAFRSNFETFSWGVVSSDEQRQQNYQSQRHKVTERGDHQVQQQPAHNEAETPNPDAVGEQAFIPTVTDSSSRLVNTSRIGGEIRYEVNFLAVRRSLLQVFLILHMPERSPAVAFRFCSHDPLPGGTTCLSVLPRCAERLPTLAHPAEVTFTDVQATAHWKYSLRCDCRIIQEGEEASVAEGKSQRFISMRWTTGGTPERTLELSALLTEVMTPMLFAVPAKLLKSTEERGKTTPQITGFFQRRSFHLMALIAHGVWCEKVARYIINESNRSGLVALCAETCSAKLKLRDDVSLDANEKWETELTFHRTESCDCTTTERSVQKPKPSKCLHVLVRGCEDVMGWGWGTASTRSGLQDLAEAVTR
ncbi:uncharacterized protein TEOVI_000467000 [Trypanosoma equiperdum]|uniref:Uncharacterized protein n=2 Tax=Trypanozoon TaxID=39700 RepID=Q583Y0_TRYB2|nr:hypothetical protein, conserved [Trypanosoma brucei brucei TREU927]AAX79805.1 hypothetical protein, conserved [Trypanosoma brucei]AAZ10894.1 hypothetical protein, conserved [Trypanosoma brucei brucei TREU927]SCU67083.1 hypothetical protein, conserved [Trypanosoma equiperdum]